MQNSMKGKFIRCIGLARATLKIGLMNLVYNVCRYEHLTRLGGWLIIADIARYFS